MVIHKSASASLSVLCFVQEALLQPFELKSLLRFASFGRDIGRERYP